MKLIKIVIFLFINLVFQKYTFGFGCDNAEYAFYFANGMFNNSDDATFSKNALQKKLEDSNIIKTEVKIAYNLNEPALVEFLQVASQKSSEFGENFWKYLSQLDIAPDSFKNIANDITKEFNHANYVIDSDLRNHVSLYEKDILTGRPIVIVAHSQGNFYANEAYELIADHYLFLSNSFKIIGVATPASYIPGVGKYTTLTQDLVIKLIRDIFGALPANIENTQSSFFGHEFVSQYLNGDKSGPKILNDIKTLLDDSTDFTNDERYYQNVAFNPLFPHSSMVAYFVSGMANEENNEDQSFSECLAPYFFDFIYKMKDLRCEERSIDSIQKKMFNIFTDCDSQANEFRKPPIDEKAISKFKLACFINEIILKDPSMVPLSLVNKYNCNLFDMADDITNEKINSALDIIRSKSFPTNSNKNF